MEKKLVLFVMHEFSIGGAERVVSHLLNNLDREKFIVHLCLFKKKGALLEELSKDVIIHDLGASRVITSAHKFIYLIMQLKPEVVFTSITHVNLLLSIFIPLLKISLKQTIFITREVNIPSVRAKYMRKSKQMDFFYKKLINNYSYIIAQSEFMKNDILHSYSVNESKLKVINNPIDVKAIHKKLKNIDLESHHFAESNKINILATGALRKQKGFDILLRVMTFLDSRYHLNILGEGEEREMLENLIKELKIEDKVTLLGFKNNPYIYMERADIVALGSRYEGFPNVILEANTCGKFVVAFECPGVGNEIIQNEINGFLVQSENVKAFADAIEKYSNMAHNKEAIIATTNRYEVKNVVKNYEHIFLNQIDRCV
jgi:glycosyltransferase involved in cell wall biosynthesis